MTSRYFFLSLLVLVLCIVPQTHSFPQAVIDLMATRQMRYHHYMWHNIRDRWLKFDSRTQSQLRNLGWAPPRPSKRYDSNGNSVAITDNNSGEDFLYMHRQMIAKANDAIAKARDPYGKIVGWKTLPGPGDREWPVPKTYTITGNPSNTRLFNGKKTDSYYYNEIRTAEKTYTDYSKLRRMTLGELGSKLEMTIHQWLHLRFSSASSHGYRPSSSSSLPNFDKKWDNSRYDWLGDTYSSHVNPVFWKLHGWVDDRIEDWRKANNLREIRWKGTWVGGPMENLPNMLKAKTGSITKGDSSNMAMNVVGNTLDKVVSIFADSGVEEASFAEPVIIP